LTPAPKLVIPTVFLVPIPAVMPPVPVPPIGTPIVPIPVRPPIISGSIVSRAVVIPGIVSGAIKDGAGNSHGDMNSCLRVVNREKSSDENDSQNKEELSHNSIG
jgi:hypothetical protein